MNKQTEGKTKKLLELYKNALDKRISGGFLSARELHLLEKFPKLLDAEDEYVFRFNELVALMDHNT